MKENNHYSFITDIERNLVIKQKQFELTFTMICILPINPLFLFPTSEKD